MYVTLKWNHHNVMPAHLYKLKHIFLKLFQRYFAKINQTNSMSNYSNRHVCTNCKFLVFFFGSGSCICYVSSCSSEIIFFQPPIFFIIYWKFTSTSVVLTTTTTNAWSKKIAPAEYFAGRNCFGKNLYLNKLWLKMDICAKGLFSGRNCCGNFFYLNRKWPFPVIFLKFNFYLFTSKKLGNLKGKLN